jgi:hypothetical protein
MTYTITECTVNNSWWWTEELYETCRVSFQNKFEKLVHLVVFIIATLFLIFISLITSRNIDLKGIYNFIQLYTVCSLAYRWAGGLSICVEQNHTRRRSDSGWDGQEIPPLLETRKFIALKTVLELCTKERAVSVTRPQVKFPWFIFIYSYTCLINTWAYSALWSREHNQAK